MRMRYTVVALIAAFVIVCTTGGAGAGDMSAIQPTPSIGPPGEVNFPAPTAGSDGATYGATLLKPFLPRQPQGAPALLTANDKFNFNDNANITGFFFVPPDPYVAVGPEHVINVGNVLIQWQRKDNPGFTENLQSLQSFFAPTPGTLGTFTFDPKAIYDQYNGRFIVIALERTSTASRILVAVSATSDPNLGWYLYSINSLLNFYNPYLAANCDHWADYPGLAVDDKAVYITCNMFTLGTAGCGYGTFGGGRLWIIDKTGTYAGAGITYTVNDPQGATIASPNLWGTQQPAHMWGAPPAGTGGQPLGTYLTQHDGLNNGLDEFVSVIEVTDALGGGGGPFFAQQYVNSGDIDNVFGGLPDAPQAGSDIADATNYPIETNDRRTLNAVWRDGGLFTCATILPNAGPDLNQATAHWWQIDTTNPPPGLAMLDNGNVGAEDLGSGTYTFFPQVFVDCAKNMAIGFAASNSEIYCGAYYATRMFMDAPGFIGPTCVLMAGIDYYERFFGGTRNRWGDYSGLALCPVDEATFWVYNEYACEQGNTGTGGDGAESGRWCTKLGSFRIKEPPVAVAISSFDVTATAGGAQLAGAFISNLDIARVNVYRGLGDDAPTIIASVPGGGVEFEYLDTTVEPGGTYQYKIGVVDPEGEFYSQIERVTIPSAGFALEQNTPNPFNPTTTIGFTLPEAQRVRLSVFDASGRLVKTLLDETRSIGFHEIQWNGTDAVGRAVGSGVYFYRLNAGKFIESRKMLLLK